MEQNIVDISVKWSQSFRLRSLVLSGISWMNPFLKYYHYISLLRIDIHRFIIYGHAYLKVDYLIDCNYDKGHHMQNKTFILDGQYTLLGK